MLDAIQFIFDWTELKNIGIDAVVYSALALVGSLLFVVRLLLGFFMDFDGAGEIDIDSDIDGSASFSVFSFLSITAFLMGTGWMGLAARLDMELTATVSAIVAVGFGLVLMFGSAAGLYGVRQLAEEKTYDTKTAVGRNGTVYMTIPGHNAGAGQVRVSISGRSMIVDARTPGPELPAFTDITVQSARDDGVLIVEQAT